MPSSDGPLGVEGSIDALVELVHGRRFVALTGAGLSTRSGIPDYRGPETRRRARNPIKWNAFARDADARLRYWARSAVGWPRFAAAAPNAAHRALHAMERGGALAGVITQNVDGLHHAAGSEAVVELHGALRRVRCLGCDDISRRADVQARIEGANPGWAEHVAELAPDGDAELDDALVAQFVCPACTECGAELRPDVVFFGEGVARSSLDGAWSLFDEAEVLLVAGSSLAVFSGLRFVREAAKRGMPIAIVNHGETRGDASATLRIDADVTSVLPALATRSSTR